MADAPIAPRWNTSSPTRLSSADVGSPSLAAARQALDASNAELARRVDSLSEQLQRATGRGDAAGKRLAAAEQQATQTREQLTALKQQLNKAAHDRDSAASAATSAQQQVAQLQEQHARLQQRLADAEAAQAVAQQRAHAELAELQAQMSSAQAAAAGAQQQLEAQRTSLEAEIATAKAAAAAAAEAEQQSAAALRGQVTEAQQRAADSQEAAAAAERRRVELEEQHAAMIRQVDAVKSDLAKIVERNDMQVGWGAVPAVGCGDGGLWASACRWAGGCRAVLAGGRVALWAACQKTCPVTMTNAGGRAVQGADRLPGAAEEGAGHRSRRRDALQERRRRPGHGPAVVQRRGGPGCCRAGHGPAVVQRRRGPGCCLAECDGRQCRGC